MLNKCMKVLKKFKEYCEDKGLYFEENNSVKTYQEDTLFCIAGMQKYKNIFLEKEEPKHPVITNNQAVLRYNDIDEINDNTHYAYFNMLGYFDFGKKDYEACIRFWMEFCFSIKNLNLCLDYIEVHPDVKKNHYEIFKLMDIFSIEVILNDSLIWQNGDIKGYSTEFYVKEVEIGNIVLLENGMIDCGFGLERLEILYNKEEYKKPEEMEILFTTATKIIECGYKPKSNGKQEYILWDILKRLIPWEDRPQLAYDKNPTAEAFRFVRDKYKANQDKYNTLKDKFPGKDKQWWQETHGIYL